MINLTELCKRRAAFCLSVLLFLASFTSCNIGKAPSASVVLSEMLSSAKELPVGRIYRSNSTPGASDYLSQGLLTALYGAESFPEVFGRTEEISLWISSGIYACEFGVFLCSNRRDAEEIVDLCLGRIDTMRHFINANSSRLSIDPSGAENLKNARVRSIGRYVIMAVWKNADVCLDAANDMIS